MLSHETALQLHALSHALPAHIHLTVPTSWAVRRVTPPELVHLAYADLAPAERTWVGSMPVTTPARAIVDVAAAHGDASVIDVAIRQALRRNHATLPELAPAVVYLAKGAGPSGPGRMPPDSLADSEGSWLTGVAPAKWTETSPQCTRAHVTQDLHHRVQEPDQRAGARRTLA